MSQLRRSIWPYWGLNLRDRFICAVNFVGVEKINSALWILHLLAAVASFNLSLSVSSSNDRTGRFATVIDLRLRARMALEHLEKKALLVQNAKLIREEII